MQDKAQAVFDVLVQAARETRTVVVSDLVQTCGFPSATNNITLDALGEVHQHCIDNGLPFLLSLLVGKGKYGDRHMVSIFWGLYKGGIYAKRVDHFKLSLVLKLREDVYIHYCKD